MLAWKKESWERSVKMITVNGDFIWWKQMSFNQIKYFKIWSNILFYVHTQNLKLAKGFAELVFNFLKKRWIDNFIAIRKEL